MKTVAVIGEGAWGTAIANVLTDNTVSVKLWCHDTAVATSINNKHLNAQYLPGVILSKQIRAYNELEDAIDNCPVIFISTPTTFFRSIVTRCTPFYNNQQHWVVLSKGIENDTLLLPSHILANVLDPAICYSVLGGPSFAQEVVAQKLTGVVVASSTIEQAKIIAQLVHTPYFKPYTSTDIIGVQTGGALKNVLALLMGVAYGMGCAENTRALLFTQGWHELMAIARAFGAHEQTLYGLAGLGDSFLTVTGIHSRNRALGIAIGQGTAQHYNTSDACVVPEGINTIRSVKKIGSRYNLLLPVFESLYAVIFESAPLNSIVQAVSSATAHVKQ